MPVNVSTHQVLGDDLDRTPHCTPGAGRSSSLLMNAHGFGGWRNGNRDEFAYAFAPSAISIHRSFSRGHVATCRFAAKLLVTILASEVAIILHCGSFSETLLFNRGSSTCASPGSADAATHVPATRVPVL